MRSKVRSKIPQDPKTSMLSKFPAILMAAWALGMASSHTFGTWFHLLLVVPGAIALLRMSQGRPAF